MTVQVECYAGYRGEQEPRAFTIAGQRFAVEAIDDRWAGPDHRYFRVTADDGDTYILRHDEREQAWTLDAYRRGPTQR